MTVLSRRACSSSAIRRSRSLDVVFFALMVEERADIRREVLEWEELDWEEEEEEVDTNEAGSERQEPKRRWNMMMMMGGRRIKGR